MEIWKPIPGFPYEASSEGRIKRSAGGMGARAGHILKPNIVSGGYFQVTLCVENVKHPIPIARLVCMAWHGLPPNPLHDAAHDDGSRNNNRPENLIWKTKKENQADRIRHGTDARGEKNTMAILTKNDVLTIRSSLETGKALAEKYRVSRAAISRIKTRRNWAHVA